MRTSRWINWVVALLGVWAIIAPFVLGFSTLTIPLWNTIVVGIALVILGIWSALSNNPAMVKTLDWINAIIGAWLIISPFVLGFSVTTVSGMWNAIIVGAIVLVLEVWAALSVRTGTPVSGDYE